MLMQNVKGQKFYVTEVNPNFDQIWVMGDDNSSLKFSRSFVKFQGHMGKKNPQFGPNFRIFGW